VIEEAEDLACPTCGEVIANPARRALHLEGLDGARPACGRTDLEAIGERARGVDRAWHAYIGTGL